MSLSSDYSDLRVQVARATQGAELVALCGSGDHQGRTARWTAVADLVPAALLADPAVVRSLLQTGLECWVPFLNRADCPEALRVRLLEETVRMIGSNLPDHQVALALPIVRSAILEGRLPVGCAMYNSLVRFTHRERISPYGHNNTARVAFWLTLSYPFIDRDYLLSLAGAEAEAGEAVIEHPLSDEAVWRAALMNPRVTMNTVDAGIRQGDPLDDPEVWAHLWTAWSAPLRAGVWRELREAPATEAARWLPRVLRVDPAGALDAWRADPARYDGLRPEALTNALADDDVEVRSAALMLLGLMEGRVPERKTPARGRRR